MKAHGQTESQLVMPVSRRDHIRGPANARITLLEYGDFQCPYCGQAHVLVKAIEKELGGKLRFVFRHFPLTNMHEFAEHASEAAEAAAAQGKFWEMHDMLFENQENLTDRALAAYASELGLDAQRILREVEFGAHARRIQEDVNSGMESDVNGTPTFFINNVKYQGDLSLDDMIAAIEL